MLTAAIVPLLAAILSGTAASVLGCWLLRRLLPDETSSLRLFVFGTSVGLVLGRIALIALGLIIGVRMAAVAWFTVSVAGALAIIGGRLLPGSLDVAEWREAQIILWVYLAFAALMALAFSSVGILTGQGYVFATYFDVDFFNHASIVAELRKGLPPQNPYFAGEPLHYYWFFHLWPAALAWLTGASATATVAAVSAPTALLFIAALALSIDAKSSLASRSVALAVAIFAPSYIGLLAILRWVAPSLLALIPKLGAPEYSLLSHSWFRDALYEPHALTALTIFLTAMYVRRASRFGDRRVATVLGILMGAILFSDTLIAVAAVGFLGLDILVRCWHRFERPAAALVTGTSLAATTAMVVALRAIPIQGGALGVGLHPVAVIAPIYLVVELGPLVIIGVTGLVLTYRGASMAERDMWLGLLVVCLALTFLVVVPDDPNTILRKGLKIAQIPLTAFAVPACAWLLERRSRLFWAAPLGLLGALTIATDLAQYLRPGSTATYVRPAEMRTLEWARQCTGDETVIQDVSEVRPGRWHRDTFCSLITAIAERRAAWGDYQHPFIFQVDDHALSERVRKLETVFQTGSPDELRQALLTLPIDVLYANRDQPGPHDAIARLVETGFLERLHCESAVCLFRLAHRPVRIRCDVDTHAVMTSGVPTTADH
jgi:hypothetical protein